MAESLEAFLMSSPGIYWQTEQEVTVKRIASDNFMATRADRQYGCGYDALEAIENLGKILASRPNYRVIPQAK